ncbi:MULTISPECIES: CPBP family intramembrane glutamic endopeptidase [unclassified Caballeronia]|uniref:CPBP family intramembrane glutamic endopeptidase n=1 Tax=unclassified Caballeronia TaxID=2646786 RepID=UPI002854A1F2|nr:MULTISPECIES: CPBP family intramembrane glutamic endopeptidase [unclassified Caballeronia]MDR5736635.1 CPBP family intramembrane metalloprotease [Caballeronia sp. LZ016]MDR5810885.1 CPBP family intramembrane metalloprotease [Caballeronia sp. LZ019]
MFFVEMVTTSVLKAMLASSGLQLYHFASIGRVLSCGIVFTVLLNRLGVGYRGLIHESSASLCATLGLYGVPILLITPALLLANCALMWLVDSAFPSPSAEWTVYNSPLVGRFGVVALVCIIAPVVEEMLFRGVMLRSFLQQYPRGVAIVHSAGVFGMAHMNVYQFMLAFLLGLLLGKLYERTRSLLPCILLHACLNTSVTIMGFMHAGDASPASLRTLLSQWSPDAAVLALVLAVPGLWMLYRLLAVNRNTRTQPD